MLNPNVRPNTVISQSFVASQFQGFNDPFIRSQPTSSLNQFVKSKQVLDSGIFQQDTMDQSAQESFGFSNITAPQEQRPAESFSRKSIENVQMNVTPRQQQFMGYNNQAFQQQPVIQNQQQFIQKDQPQQQFSNQQYQQQFIQQSQSQQQPNKMISAQSPQQRFVSPFTGKTQSPKESINQQFTQYIQSQKISEQQTSQPPIDPLANSRPQLQTSNFSGPTLQQSKAESYSQQYSQKILEGSKVSTQQIGEGSSIGKKLKLNVSQEFSNSFVLKCVNQPQKSTILQMKQRQRQYRKSIQNFFS